MIIDTIKPNSKHQSEINGRHVVFFDGYCNLCNGSVSFISKRNKRNQLVFVSLQSSLAQDILGVDFNKSNEPDSIAFLEEGNLYSESTAVLKICIYLDRPYPLLKIFLIVPRFVRDAFYRWVAKNRYKWFGKRDTCRIPTEAERDMFLD